MSEQHGKISPTAKWVAQYRQYSDIPYAKEVADLLKPERGLQALIKGAELLMDIRKFFGPFMEARYKGMLNAIRETEIKQVVEFASGVTLRGLALTQKDPSYTYVETDLPGILEEKLAIVAQITKDLPSNWHNVTVNALSLEDIRKAVELLPPQTPVCFAHEGLMQYLNFSEKETLAKNIRTILQERGGAWVTADLDTKEHADLKVVSKKTLDTFRNLLSRVTGRDLAANAFETSAHRDEFFRNLGFTLTSRPFVHGPDELSSLKTLEIDEKTIARLPSPQSMVVWTLRLA